MIALTSTPLASKLPFAAHYPAIHQAGQGVQSRQVRRASSRRAAKNAPSSGSIVDRNQAVIEAIGQSDRRQLKARARGAGAAAGRGAVVGTAGQFTLGLDEEIRVDLFCGGGGASEGIEIATGEAVTIAVNHDEAAISMHRANHPHTDHYLSGVHDVCPRAASAGRRVGHLHASPDCRHFSQAKGGQPRDREIRSLAWIVHRWAGMVGPRLITMENVEAMKLWTTLVAKRDPQTGRAVKLDKTVAAIGERVPVEEQFLVPDKKTLGKTFRRFIAGLRAIGYQVEYRTLVAADLGAPTTRERLYLIARNDGRPIIWPTQTHAKVPARGQKAWRGAHECIDWSFPSQSVFGRKKDLAPATMRRVAKGIQRFVLDAADPFIVPLTHQGADRVHSIREPLRTVTGANRGELGLAEATLAPVMIQAGHGEGAPGARRWSHGSKRPTDPLGTITASGGGQAVAAATLIQTGYGERKGQDPRVPGLTKPLGTVVAGGAKHAVVTAFMAQANDGFNQTPGHDLRRPMTTVTNKGSQQQLVTASLMTMRHFSVGVDARTPVPTVAAGGEHHALMQCVLSDVEHAGALRVAKLMRDVLGDPDDTTPLEPVTVVIDGIVYAIVDICLRMLQPKELFAAQGFPENYVFDRGADGHPLTKTEQIRMCGNSVSPIVMAAIVAANDWRFEPMKKAA